MKISEHANYLLNEYGRLQFDYAAYCKPYGESLRNEARNNLEEYIAEMEEAQRWIPVSERLPDCGHREFYEVACIYQEFGELALFSKGRWVIYEGENIYDVTERVMFWRKRQYLPDEVIATLRKKVQE
jgi:hypothetical protein